MVATHAAGASGPLAELTAGELEERYCAYRRHQASLLVKALPREAIRPLYRRARARTAAAPHDPLALLVSLCEELLPLPPFDVWKADLLAHPDGHLRDLGDWAEAPAADRPATTAVRRFSADGRRWVAFLRAYRVAGGWRGLIAFRDESGRVFRTAGIFHEPCPTELTERFATFDDASLEAFLRSALP